jgi:hypothetical protein
MVEPLSADPEFNSQYWEKKKKNPKNKVPAVCSLGVVVRTRENILISSDLGNDG